MILFFVYSFCKFAFEIYLNIIVRNRYTRIKGKNKETFVFTVLIILWLIKSPRHNFSFCEMLRHLQGTISFVTDIPFEISVFGRLLSLWPIVLELQRDGDKNNALQVFGTNSENSRVL